MVAEVPVRGKPEASARNALFCFLAYEVGVPVRGKPDASARSRLFRNWKPEASARNALFRFLAYEEFCWCAR